MICIDKLLFIKCIFLVANNFPQSVAVEPDIVFHFGILIFKHFSLYVGSGGKMHCSFWNDKMGVHPENPVRLLMEPVKTEFVLNIKQD